MTKEGRKEEMRHPIICTFVPSLTSTFDIPCSIFDIHFIGTGALRGTTCAQRDVPRRLHYLGLRRRAGGRWRLSDGGSLAGSPALPRRRNETTDCTTAGETKAKLPINIARPNVIMPRNMAIPLCTQTANMSVIVRVARGHTSTQ